jgi:hypothetical protein
MRMTTGLLLTAALLLPGAAQAQFGGPGSVSPAAGAVPRLPGAAQAQFGGPGLPYDPLQDGLRPRIGAFPGMPNIPGVTDGYGPIGPGGIPGLPRSPYDRFGLDPSLRGVPGLPGRLGTPTLSQIAESNGAGLPGRLGMPNIPGVTVGDAGRLHVAPNLVPAAPNVPRITLPSIDPKVIDPSKTWVLPDYKRDLITPRPTPSPLGVPDKLIPMPMPMRHLITPEPTPSPLGGCGSWALNRFGGLVILGALFGGIGAIFGRGKKGSKG